MNWKRTSSEPITTERHVKVTNFSGLIGYLSIRWVRNGPQPYGPVTSDAFEGRRRILDDNPTLVGRTSEL